MNIYSLDVWIILTGVMATLVCSIPGTVLVLRNNALLADAISHAILPGIAIGFMITGTRNSPAMFIGAAVVAVLVALGSEALYKHMNIEKSAGLGVMFSIFFALGLIFISQGSKNVDLDPSCVLFGALELTPLYLVSIFGLSFPQAFVTLFILFLLQLSLFVIFYKEIKIFCFDPALAHSLGYNTKWFHYILIGNVAITTVALFEVTGSILTISLLILPPATALLLTRRFLPLFLTTMVVGIISVGGGYAVSILIPQSIHLPDSSMAGGIAVFAFLLLQYALWHMHAKERRKKRRLSLKNA